jgi:signal transduction histidine kinase
MKLLITFLFILFCGLAFAEEDKPTKESGLLLYKNLEKDLSTRRISSYQYLQKTDSLTLRLISQGIVYDNTDLLRILSTFKTLAWSKDEYHDFRVSYFNHLLNSSETLGKAGMTMFYVEKFQKEVEKSGEVTLSNIFNLVKFNVNNRNTKKAVEIFEENKDRIRSIALDPKTATAMGNIRIIRILPNVVYSYVSLENEKKYNEVRKLAKELAAYTVTLPEMTQALKVETEILLYYIDHQIAYRAKKDYAKTEQILRNIDHAVNQNKDSLGTMLSYIQRNLIDMKVRYFLTTKNNDSAKVYIDILENAAKLTNSHSSLLSIRKSTLAANQNDYKLAFKFLEDAMNKVEEEFAGLSSEMDDLLYAHSEAEYNKMELEAAETVKSKRLNWIIGISAGALLVLIAVGYYLFLLKRRTKKQIRELDEITQVQIDEAVQRAAKEEQRKLGQDLHDDLSSTLASLIRQIDYVKHELDNNENISEKLGDVHTIAKNVYNTVRNKSHSIHDVMDDEQKDHFDESIKKIVDSALSSKHYQKEIDIEKNASILLGVNTRIEILRIVQEAMANIVKHAKKATEVYVFLLKTEKGVNLQMGDNGMEISAKNSDSKGIGMRSIQNRVKNLNGDISLNTHSGGLHLDIFIPMNFSNIQ